MKKNKNKKQGRSETDDECGSILLERETPPGACSLVARWRYHERNTPKDNIIPRRI
ncbi:hypothetical protein BDV41DRAFT_545902 [Aspergillus transmontanensis]|uniref:Uncharacterized protein n=1 Tax=Aspergillus transmontanensis TaxID=1034304 RepID=A0A5N6VSP7_9EURO|nr:hypothetical protein BDV41DRAFT_545902 [Aspergillus transmontanensis]